MSKPKAPGRPVSGEAQIRRLIRDHMPGDLAAIYDSAPDLTDPAWQAEFGRMLFALFLKSNLEAHAAEDPVEAHQWHQLAKQHSEELRKLKYLESQQKETGIPGRIEINVHGLKRKGDPRGK